MYWALGAIFLRTKLWLVICSVVSGTFCYDLFNIIIMLVEDASIMKPLQLVYSGVAFFATLWFGKRYEIVEEIGLESAKENVWFQAVQYQ